MELANSVFAAMIPRLVAACIGEAAARAACARLVIAPQLANPGLPVARSAVAMALNVLLFDDLLARVPAGGRYVSEVTAAGGQVLFDHGALRTIDGQTGALPRGDLAFARLLESLGYVEAGLYPLPRLKMTGHVFSHRDFPEMIPQFFVSALHIAELPEIAQAAAARVFGASIDPLGTAERALLAALAGEGACDFALAAAGLPGLVRAFGCHHPAPALADYETLLAHSEEAAWIATEGNRFNHATDRVADVEALAERLKAEGYAIKPAVEISASRRVRQTALIAAPVLREFRLADGTLTTREVPGSFYEFISRDADPASGSLDLRFDAGNATGIFAVTNAAGASA